MKCKNCGAKLPIDAMFCDVCGHPIERQTYKQKAEQDAKKRKATKFRLMIIVPIVLICIAFAGYKLWDIYWFKNIHLEPNYGNMRTRVTLDEYNKLELGMTYKEACNIAGGRGKLESIVGTAKTGMRSYIWAGEHADVENSFYSEVAITIDNRTKKIDSIYEYNLVDAEEVLSNNKNDTKAYYKKYGKIEIGMKLKEVEEILGTKGALYHSSSTKANNIKTTRKEYRWHGPNVQVIIVGFKNDIVESANEYGFD